MEVTENISQSHQELIKNYEAHLTLEEMQEAFKVAIETKRQREYRRQYSQELLKERTFEVKTVGELEVLFEQRYKENEGRYFEHTTFNGPVLSALSLYFANDKRFEELDESYSLDKGIMLQGPVGCCKTSMMKAFQLIGFRGFGVIPCKELERLYDKNGFASIEKYTKLELDWYKREHGWLFDDLGWEEAGKHYGKRVNVMEDVLEAIDRRKTSRVFHITTNDDAPALIEKYGERITSRLRSMFNQISYDPNAKDMRS